MPRALSICSTPGCPEFTSSGRCAGCRQEADQRRGTAHQRGYGKKHQQFRQAVLARDSVCVVCGQEPSVVADHHPHSRRELIDMGCDPDDPAYGRGVCKRDHDRSTAVAQPGGWNQR